jgi:hypothetical protein
MQEPAVAYFLNMPTLGLCPWFWNAGWAMRELGWV